MKENKTVSEKRLWIISVSTKYGTDVVLIKQEERPTGEELSAIEERFKHDLALEEVYASTDCGFRDIGKMPASVGDYLKDK